MNDARRDFVSAELLERRGDRLDRALHIALDDKRKFLFPGLAELAHHLFERAATSGADCLQIAQLAHAVGRQFTSAGFGVDHRELIACFRRAVEAEHLNRDRRSGRAHMLARIVDQGTHAAPGAAGDDDLPYPECAALHQNRAHRPASAFQLGLDDDALGRTVRIRPKLQNLRLQADHFQQRIEILAGLGRDFDFERIAAQ